MKKWIIAALLMVASFSACAWEYDEKVDQMRGTKTSFAYTTSLNRVDFAFPYNGGSALDVQLRKGQKFGSNVMLVVSKGQFSCFADCVIHIKFDEGKVETFDISRAENGASDVVFINNYSRFVAKLRKAKKLIIEADFYNAGSKQFQFGVAGLKWKS